MEENSNVVEQLEEIAAEEEMLPVCQKKSHSGLIGFGLIAVGAAAIAAVIAKKRKKNDGETIEEGDCDEDIEVEDLDEPFEAMAEATGMNLEEEESEEK